MGTRLGRRRRAGWASLVIVLACVPSASDPGPEPAAPPPGEVTGEQPEPRQPGPPEPRPDPVPTRRCDPTAGPAIWTLEGEPVEATLRCATGETKDIELAIEDEDLPPGATFDAATATLAWRPSKGQAATWSVRLVDRRSGEHGTLKLGVVPTSVGLVNLAEPERYTEEYGLPVFHFFHDGELTAGHYRPAELVYRGRRYTIELKYRGATSSVFPKRSFTVKFPDDALFTEPVFGNGFTARKKLVLITAFNDNSYLRPRLAFELWNRMSPEHVQVRTFSAVVYRNGRYFGVFTAADHIDDELLERHGMSGRTDLYKTIDNEANFSRYRLDGTLNPDPMSSFEKKAGRPEYGDAGWFDRMGETIGWVTDVSADEFAAGFPQRFNAREYEDWWIFNTLILGTDTQGKNAYHAWDPVTGGPWRYIPWDLDASLGQNYDTTRTAATERITFAEDNHLFSRMLLEPMIAGPMRQRYRELLRNELRIEEVLKLYDQLVAETEQAARRDWSRWQTEYRNFGQPGTDPYWNFPRWHERKDMNTYEGEVQYLRTWLTDRWNALEEDLP